MFYQLNRRFCIRDDGPLSSSNIFYINKTFDCFLSNFFFRILVVFKTEGKLFMITNTFSFPDPNFGCVQNQREIVATYLGLLNKLDFIVLSYNRTRNCATEFGQKDILMK